jgi:hypothetical protein
MIDDIFTALLLSDSADIPIIKKYVAFLRFRRRMYEGFYPSQHWVMPEKKYHWVGSSQ